jgi:hypothetical protein
MASPLAATFDGSTIAFSDPRDAQLEGLPRAWRVFAVTGV